MTPREKLELDAIIAQFRREVRSSKLADRKARAQACLGALLLLKDRLAFVARERKRFRYVAGGRG